MRAHSAVQGAGPPEEELLEVLETLHDEMLQKYSEITDDPGESARRVRARTCCSVLLSILLSCVSVCVKCPFPRPRLLCVTVMQMKWLECSSWPWAD